MCCDFWDFSESHHILTVGIITIVRGVHIGYTAENYFFLQTSFIVSKPASPLFMQGVSILHVASVIKRRVGDEAKLALLQYPL